jgi:hypothetical protein
MTEAEWLVCADPRHMLEFVQGKPTDRKLRLFACACCHRIWALLDVESGKNVELAERFAEGRAGNEEMPTPWPLEGLRETPSLPEEWGKLRAIGWARDATKMAAALATDRMGLFHPAWQAAYYAAGAIAWEMVGAARKSSEAETWASNWNAAEAGEHKHQVTLLDDIIGNPFRPVAVDPSWLTNGVVNLACSIYENRIFDRMPVLADALEEAGCTNANMLNHCRQLGEHVRGCWVLDLLLGKE